MWALLDIRTGRANRAQFLTLFAFSGFMFLIGILNETVRVSFVLMSLYVFFVAYVRRVRDTGFAMASIYILSSIFLLVTLFFVGFMAVTYLIGGDNLYMLFYLSLSFFPVFLLIGTIPFCLLLYPLILPGYPAENVHGLPPVGLDFRTMTPQTYPARAAEIFRASQEAPIKTQEHTDHTVTNQYEFKGRKK